MGKFGRGVKVEGELRWGGEKGGRGLWEEEEESHTIIIIVIIIEKEY